MYNPERTSATTRLLMPSPHPFLAPPHFVVLDTAHWAGLVADVTSNDREKRRAALVYIPNLIERGWLPLICWHHVEELLQHGDDQVVDNRLRYLRSQPLLAWIRPLDPEAGLGSVLDILRAEASAALRLPEADAIRVRDVVKKDLIAVGTGVDAIPEIFRDWRLLRDALSEHQQNNRRVAAIARWRATDIDNKPISELLGKTARNPNDAARVLDHLRKNLKNEIATRGDKRIPDAAAMATEFIDQVVRDNQAGSEDFEDDPVIRILRSAGLQSEDIDLSATFGETMDFLTFQNRLRIATQGFNVPWSTLSRSVTQRQLPVIVIEEAMRRHAQDQKERKGSELNDTHLLCLAPYADMTYVDKRTLENLRRARSKISLLDQLLGGVARANDHAEVAAKLVPQ